MRVYYLRTPLSPTEVREVEKLMGWTVEQVRVPFLIPDGRGHKEDRGVPEAPLKSAGIPKEYGGRSAIVQISPESPYWTTQFVEAIGRLTGRWPYLIQTAETQVSGGELGQLRVLDMDGAMRV